mgnify:CR=1 FL=1
MPAGTRLKGDTLKLETYMFIEQLPIPQLKIENKELAQIERLIDNNNYTEIEYIVYNLYGLTQDEINYINSL